LVEDRWRKVVEQKRENGKSGRRNKVNQDLKTKSSKRRNEEESFRKQTSSKN